VRPARPICALLLLAAIPAAGGCELVLGPRFAIHRALDAVAEGGIVEAETELSFRFVSRTMEVEGDRATVFARGEASGTYRGVETDCICVEVVHLARQGGRWEVVGFPLSRLGGVVEILEARHAALRDRDLEAYLALVHPEYGEEAGARALLEARIGAVLADAGEGPVRQRILGRTMRIERHEAVVTERWRLETEDGKTVEGRARYVLAPTEDGWRFVGGLM
jgi:ketosteroid isomerase-like protein